MIAVVQRVSRASVSAGGSVRGSIGRGLVILLGVARGDGPGEAVWLADKCASLRIFNDAGGLMNVGLRDVGGGLLVISQFTLLGDCRKGRRPSFVDAAPPETAGALYEAFVARLREMGHPVETGVFQAMMDVELVNDGPVTLIVETQGTRGGAET
jgi:D-tyrosyl-tRNA(Tyr) deacylase